MDAQRLFKRFLARNERVARILEKQNSLQMSQIFAVPAH